MWFLYFITFMNTNMITKNNAYATTSYNKNIYHPHKAYIIRGRLELEGIYTFLKDEMTV